MRGVVMQYRKIVLGEIKYNDIVVIPPFQNTQCNRKNQEQEQEQEQEEQ